MIDTFNPSLHIIQLKSQQGPKDYLPVQWRLVWFRRECPEGTITTELLDLNRAEECETEISVWDESTRKYKKEVKHAKGVAVFKATVTDGKGGVATGTKTENAACFPDYLEKAETGSIGRALAALGYGTQFAPELDEGEERIVDAPVTRTPSYDPDKPCTEQQLATLDKLRAQLGMQSLASTDGLTFGDVASMLQDLQKQLQAKRKAS
jgi:hypothetical protein